MQTIRQEILIGGCGRSGTTLLGSMIGSHSRCICPPESHFKTSPFRLGMWRENQIDPEAAWAYIQIHWRFKIWQLDVKPQAAPKSSYIDLLHWLVEQYAAAHGLTGDTWVDHTPENINYAPTLLHTFPQAKVVHIIRDGRAVANSIMPLDWGPNTIIEAAEWWKEIVQAGLALENTALADRIIRVKYEDLVFEPETTITQLCAKLRLDYEPLMLTASGFHPPGYTTGQHKMIGKRPDPNRAHRWEEALTSRQIEMFEHIAGDLLKELEYPLRHQGTPVPPTSRERQKAELKELWRGKIWNTFRWFRRSYPVWLSWDFLRVLADSRQASQKTELPTPPTENSRGK